MKIQDLLIMIIEIFLIEVEIEYVDGKDLAHFEITPFVCLKHSSVFQQTHF